ncbi:hypothetical protein HPB49_010038 [Dermacentor silvarum]|uniref:Uncharacterized protein n=1 Tax=Dermacentor silvarum TaxID=543639 RepID=A0ACB8CED4_DERSI|nr:hypothetical protein HPB49_010038 [Dermacentor silvarum]
MGVCCSVILALIVDCCYSTLASPCPARAPAGESATGTSPLETPQRESSEEMMSVLLRVLRVQLEVRQQNRDVLHELQQLRHEVRVVSERLDEIEPLDRTRAVSQPALSTVPPVLPRLPADNIEELEAAEAAVQDEAVAATLNAFGILVTRWRILERAMGECPENAEETVKALCGLDNFLMDARTGSDDFYCGPGYADSVSPQGQRQSGQWRQLVV